MNINKGLIGIAALMAMSSEFSITVPPDYRYAPKRMGGKRVLPIKEFKPNKPRRAKYKKKRNRAGK